MSKRLVISSTQNPRIKAALRLQDRKDRREKGLMLVEGYHELSLAWEAGLTLTSLFVCCEVLNPEETNLLNSIEAQGTEVIEISEHVLKRLAYREHPDAWIAVAKSPALSLEEFSNLLDENSSEPALIIIAESLEKPGNLGAILRSAEGAGAHGVLVCEGRTDLFNPNVVRAGKGTLFSQKVVECSNLEAWAWLKTRKIPVLLASPEGKIRHWDADLKGPVALLVGTEKEGVSSFWTERAAQTVNIPMYGRINSLNVAQAATLLLYEALRQRKK